MRSFGWIMGGLFFLDGLTALVGGKQVMDWADKNIGPNLPPRWRQTLEKAKDMDRDLYLAWGLNNIIAGSSIMLLSLLLGDEED